MQKKVPILTIAIPTYNRPQELKSTLLNVLDQINGREGVDIFITDNSDNNKSEMTIYEIFKNSNIKFRYHRNSVNIGIDSNIEQAVIDSLGEYVWILSDDDEIKAGALDRVISIISEKKPSFIYVNSCNKEHQSKLMVNSAESCVINSVDDVLKKIGIAITFVSGFIVNRNMWIASMENTRLSGSFVLLCYRCIDIVKNFGNFYFIATPLVNFRSHFGTSFNYFEAFGVGYVDFLLYSKKIGLSSATYNALINQLIVHKIFTGMIHRRIYLKGENMSIKIMGYAFKYKYTFPLMYILVLPAFIIPSFMLRFILCIKNILIK